MSATHFVYEGGELDLFKRAENWKRYWSGQVRPHLGARVLEVGAGIGVNTPYLNHGAEEWVCLEPDRNMAALLVARQRAKELGATRVIAGTIADLPREPSFDSIVYIDVLEHIEDDAAEIAAGAARLRPGGTLIVLSPAHAWLYSPFDAAIGHYRRYSAKGLRALACSDLELVNLRYIDSVGMLASMANSFFLKPEMPTLSQILIWDRLMVPVSRLLDPLFLYGVGKSIIAVWRRC
jgi:2-polyprenyl-3-methyl-5-hydroxy-6-metoxy-1,4-benzoquinol methylase